jgi:hypothetical protein
MSHIIRIQPDELTERLLESKEEVLELSPLEIYDKKENTEWDGDDEPKLIIFENTENHFEKQKKVAKLNNTLKVKENKKTDGKSNFKGTERHQG